MRLRLELGIFLNTRLRELLWEQVTIKGVQIIMTTPDGRYFVVRGKLWRMANPGLDEAERSELLRQLGTAPSGCPRC